MINAEFREGVTETLEILKHMDKSYTDMIPQKFKDFLEKNKSDNYIPNLDHSKKINEMNIKEKTKAILATIYLNYWCNAEQKEAYQKTLRNNEAKYQEKLRKLYNPDDMFKNKEPKIMQQEEVQASTDLAELKETLFNKIIKKIKHIFSIK